MLLAGLAQAPRAQVLVRRARKVRCPGVKGTYPRNASAEQKADLLDLVQSFATNLGVILPEGQEIEIVESARRAGGDFLAFVAYLDRTISTTILGQSATTDMGPWRGTAEVQRDVRDETVAADAACSTAR